MSVAMAWILETVFTCANSYMTYLKRSHFRTEHMRERLGLGGIYATAS